MTAIRRHVPRKPVRGAVIWMETTDLADDFDQVALVIDWLDACRKRDLAALLDLYADDATFECGCDEI